MNGFRVELENAAAAQGVELSENEIEKLFEIAVIVIPEKSLFRRIDTLRHAGFEVTQKPMHTGYGLVLCMKRMRNKDLRVRISGNRGGKQGNYSYCVHI